MTKKTADSPGVPVAFNEDAPEPRPIPVAIPPSAEDVPESNDSGPKSGQKAATQKKES